MQTHIHNFYIEYASQSARKMIPGYKYSCDVRFRVTVFISGDLFLEPGKRDKEGIK